MANSTLPTDPGKALHLADTFNPDVDLLTSEGLIAFGVKGSGKSNLLAKVSEQLGRFFLPQIILDTDREYHSLLNFLHHGVLASANRFPSGYDILHKGLQVVVDLKSWESDEAAALAMVQLINELFTTASAQAPQDRVPCVISLDEASYWLPQETVPYLSKGTRQAIADAFPRLASRGRKLGLVPFLYTQSISEVSKTSIRQAGVKVLMRQTLDIDLNRYAEYIRNCTPAKKKAIAAFSKGKAIVILPDGTQQVIQFYPRESAHPSSTPRARSAIVKFAHTALDVDALVMRDMTTAQVKQRTLTDTLNVPGDHETPAPSAKGAINRPPTSLSQEKKLKHALTLKERAFILLKKDPNLSSRDLAALLGCPQNTAQIHRKAFLDQPAPAMGKQEAQVRALLAENPNYTVTQLARRIHGSSKDVRKILARTGLVAGPSRTGRYRYKQKGTDESEMTLNGRPDDKTS